MSLQSDVSKIKNWQQLCVGEDGTTSPVSHAIIIATMAVDIGEITELNWKEFYRRVYVAERLNGAFLRAKKNIWAVVDDKNFVVYEEEEIAAWASGEIVKNGGAANVVSGEKTYDRYITPEDVYAHIGLTTNVKTKPNVPFKTKVEQWSRDAAARHVKF